MTDEFKNCELCLSPLEVVIDGKRLVFIAHTPEFCAAGTRDHIAQLRLMIKRGTLDHEVVKRQCVALARELDRARDLLAESRGDRCPNCGIGPLHASESDDLGRCAKCAAASEVKDRVDAAEIAIARRALAEAEVLVVSHDLFLSLTSDRHVCLIPLDKDPHTCPCSICGKGISEHFNPTAWSNP